MSLNVTIARPGVPTPLVPSGGTFSASSSIAINASCDRVFDIITDLQGTGSWNTANAVWVLPSDDADGAPYDGIPVPGTKLQFFARLDPKSDSLTVTQNHITIFDRTGASNPYGYVFGHRHDGQPDWALLAERVYKLTDLVSSNDPHASPACLYEGHETFSGALAYGVMLAEGDNLKSTYGRWATSLKAKAESSR